MKNTTQDQSKSHTSSGKPAKGGDAQGHEEVVEKKDEAQGDNNKISQATRIIRGSPAVQSKPPGKRPGVGGQTG